MKIAPIHKALTAHPQIEQILVHTGQHYGHGMSDQFFSDLGMPAPAINLEVGSDSHAQQTAKIMQLFEAVVLEHKPDAVLVVGDVNSTIACALTAKKLNIKVIHVEAGLRSFDMEMPEEINRILTDRLSDLLFITEESAEQNLKNEGVDANKIHFVGNVMIDSLVSQIDRARDQQVTEKLSLADQSYLLATIHRPSNVDAKKDLERTVDTLCQAAERLPLLVPLHPRTIQNLEQNGFADKLQSNPNIHISGPLGYLDFLRCQMGARAILTDSGGIQEESTYLGVPCLTMRENTERPATITQGSNRLIGTQTNNILSALDELLKQPARSDRRPPLWDGNAAIRIADVLSKELDKPNVQ
ncbi:UNVERIFIED_CONTAM: hypothetical protein GTU68_042980 [Idotea baltica]|nr:hypothetical protein [Idotea baltica]